MAQNTQRVSYTSRNFADIRTDLVNMVKQYYPDIFNDFNDASVGMMLLELNAAVGDMLSFNTDRMFQEAQLDYAQQRSSVLSMARTFGLKVPNTRPSATIVDFSVTIPVYGNTFDISYTPLIQAGAQVSGGGKIFETQYDIDFSSPFSVGGIPNRIIIPNFDANGNLLNYTVTKREIVINGYTKIYKRVISTSDVVPFLEIMLPDNNVLSINSVITLNGTNFTSDPTQQQFANTKNKWYEVDALAEDTLFVPDYNTISDNPSVVAGKYITVNQKFIREYTDLGFTKLIFGGGNQDTSSLYNFGVSSALINQIGDFINNLSLGTTLSPNTTLFVSYRVGGGADTNIGQGIINGVGQMNFIINGSNQTINNAVKSSLSVNNPIPALGGRDAPSINEIRNLVRYNFSAQNRAVTIKDYQSIISLMDSQYGVPFKVGVVEYQNKIQVYIMGLNSSGNLDNSSTSTLTNNIATYLSDYRMMNDYVEVSNAKIVNLQFQIDVYADKSFPQSQIVTQIVNDVTSFMDVNNFDMGENIYLANLNQTVNSVPGVVNVIDLRVYNLVGGNYSVNQISQPYLDPTTGQIDISQEYTLFGEQMTMFEIKYPSIDIICRIK